MKPDKDKTHKLCLRQQTQICGVNILYGKIIIWTVRRYISQRKWIFYSRFTIARRRRTADRHMGVSECQWHSSCEPTEPTGKKAASELSEAVPQGYIHQSSYKRQNQRLSCWHRQAGAGTLWKAHWGYETGVGHNRTFKSWKCLGLGRKA